ncbi:hypothetical protein B0181_07520 [Moraxella caviae]|uniref:Tetrahydromethanopterin S-methyltransferase n=1 Tax=Moraxella caviae TaxID=34060 RepID=A0A1S9ZZZ5_9GAMM|nr:hypothetical protein [Moraxella caviae]OOR89008.1 hypothetical protein B0181_07520 [Moraxella caviae]STZ14763.1 Uncharacterised protein [Moraxella caviae]VEW13977.1 Uncharacterised protein [Moraxella caviae]
MKKEAETIDTRTIEEIAQSIQRYEEQIAYFRQKAKERNARPTSGSIGIFGTFAVALGLFFLIIICLVIFATVFL